MKIAKWFGLLLLGAAPLLNGCAGFWNPPASTTTATTTTTLTSGVFFVLNINTAQIVSYYVDAGTLTQIATYATPNTPLALAVSPSNGFLYLSTVNGIYIYTIASGGTLTLGNSSSIISNDQPYALQVDSTGTWLVEGNCSVAELCAIPISTSTGLPTSKTEQVASLPSSDVHRLTISPDNNNVFVALGTNGTAVIPFTSGNANPFGTVGNIPVTTNLGAAAISVAVDPSDRLLYIGEINGVVSNNSGGLRVFKYASLPTIAEITGSPFATGGLGPSSILPISSGSYVYVANELTSSGSAGLIKGFSITNSSGVYSLTALGSTFSAGITTMGLAQDSTAKFVFAVSSGGSYDLTGYVFDAANLGYLDTVAQSKTGTDPVLASAIAAAH
jgi:6-phosphogluconolactonase (cycloisomerase 2 family)